MLCSLATLVIHCGGNRVSYIIVYIYTIDIIFAQDMYSIFSVVLQQRALTAPGRGSGTGWLYVYHC